jgi:hypothetical protein
MKNAPKPPASGTNRKDFCVCRVLEDTALIKIESLGKLFTAKKYMRRLAAHVPGSYVIFSRRTRRVLSKTVSHAHGPLAFRQA